MDNTNKQTYKGYLWVFIERFAQRFIGLIFSIILMRILKPSDFGLIATITLFSSVGNLLIESGLGWALIQKKEITEIDKNTVFWMTVTVSIICYSIIFFISPLFSAFYNENKLNFLIKISCLQLLLSPFSVIQYSILNRSMLFSKISIANITGWFFGGTLTVIWAWYNGSVIALAAQPVIQRFVTTVMLWIQSPWRPKIAFSLQSWKTLFNYGGFILSANFLDNFLSNFYNSLIAKIYSQTDLGVLTKAKTFQELPIGNVNIIINRVSFPVISSIQTNQKKLANYCYQVVLQSYVLVLPISFFTYLFANDAVILVFGSKWLAMVPYIKVLCIAGISRPLSSIYSTVLLAMGKPQHLFIIQGGTKLILVSSLLFGRWLDLIYISYIYVFIEFLTMLVIVLCVKNVIIRMQWKSLFTHITAGIVICFTICLIITFLRINIEIQNVTCRLIIWSFLSCLLYLFIVFFWQKKLVNKIVNILITRIKNKIKVA